MASVARSGPAGRWDGSAAEGHDQLSTDYLQQGDASIAASGLVNQFPHGGGTERSTNARSPAALAHQCGKRLWIGDR